MLWISRASVWQRVISIAHTGIDEVKVRFASKANDSEVENRLKAEGLMENGNGDQSSSKYPVT